jgi:hypothetical protein
VRSVDVAVGTAASCFSTVERGELGLRCSLKYPWKDQRGRSVFGVLVAESGCTATGGASDSGTGGESDVGGEEAPFEATGSSESGVAAVAGASVGFLLGASSALCVCDGVAAVDLSRALMKSNKAMLRTRVDEDERVKERVSEWRSSCGI